MSQSVCPWNVSFSQEVKELAFAARPALGSPDGVKDARTLARELLAMSQPELSAAFKGSPMKRQAARARAQRGARARQRARRR